MEKTTCQSCAYFIQHYALDNRSLFRVYCGHCRFSNPKRKLPDAKACENYVPGKPDEDAFATKEYLSKELLQYLLHLELLPQIVPPEQDQNSQKGQAYTCP